PGSAGAVPPHAARGEAEFADERGHVDPDGLRPGGGSGGGGRSDGGVAAADLAGSAGELVGEARRNVGRRNSAGGGILHGRSVVAHRGSGVGRGAPVSAVRVHRFGCGERRRLGNGFRARSRVGPGSSDGGRGGGPGGGGVTPDGAPAGTLGGGVYDWQGAHAAEVVGVPDGRWGGGRGGGPQSGGAGGVGRGV